MIRPRLTEYKKLQKLSEYPENTCYSAGHLVVKNAGWRSVRPVIDGETCIGCYRCYMFCPDGVIFKEDKAEKRVAIDYDFCKGCGICAKVCPVQAIRMEDERHE